MKKSSPVTKFAWIQVSIVKVWHFSAHKNKKKLFLGVEELFKGFPLFHTKAKTVDPHREVNQLRILELCSSDFGSVHYVETDSYWFFSVKNSTFAPSVRFMVEEPFSENISGSGCAFGVCWLTPLVCLPNSNNKWSFQMIQANKAGEWQITRGHHAGSARLCVCAFMSVSVQLTRGPKGWSSSVPKTEWRSLKRLFSLLLLSLLPFMAELLSCFTRLYMSWQH